MSLIVHLLLYLSLHASSARPLGVIDKENIGGQLSSKTEEPAVAENLEVKEKLRIGIDESIILARRNCANLIQHKNSEALIKINEESEGNNVALSSMEVMHKPVEIEDQRSQARILKSLADDADESVDPKENDMGEDIVVMDYAQPHRKPPIHNKEP